MNIADNYMVKIVSYVNWLWNMQNMKMNMQSSSQNVCRVHSQGTGFNK